MHPHIILTSIIMRKTYNIIRKSWATATRLYSRAMRHVGLPFVYGGVACLALLYATGLTNYNTLNILPIIAIFLGIVGYVKGEKRKSLY